MKLKLILASIDEAELSIVSRSKLELELSAVNIFTTDVPRETPPSISSTDELNEGNVNLYFTNQRAVEALAPTVQQLETIFSNLESGLSDLNEDLSGVETSVSNLQLNMNDLNEQLNGIDALLDQILGG